jgi:hypothetical protein
MQALQDELEVARVEVVHMAREKDIIIAGKQLHMSYIHTVIYAAQICLHYLVLSKAVTRYRAVYTLYRTLVHAVFACV